MWRFLVNFSLYGFLLLSRDGSELEVYGARSLPTSSYKKLFLEDGRRASHMHPFLSSLVPPSSYHTLPAAFYLLETPAFLQTLLPSQWT